MPDFESEGRSRRRLGVSFFSVFRATRKLTRDSDFEPISTKDFAQQVLENILGKPLPQARQDEPGVDWDALLAFIERILPIILALFGL